MSRSRAHARVCFWFALLAVLCLAASGCRQHDERTSPPSGPAPSAVRCPIVPLRLVLSSADTTRPAQPILGLDEAGQVRVLGPLAADRGADRVVARLDPRGCVHGNDGVWVEMLGDGNLWTLRAITTAQGNRLKPGQQELAIEADGRVTGYDSTGVGQMRLEGYRQEGLCAAKLLLQCFASMMGGLSMAVVDGVAPRLPPPASSVCPELHRSQPAQPAGR